MKKISMTILFFILLVFQLTNVVATTSNSPLPTVDYVDLKKYAGSWYEISRLPNWFEKKALYGNVKANYTLNEKKGYVKVHNSYQDKNGNVKSAHAIAFVVDKQTNSRLKVSFTPLLKYLGIFPAPYEIIALDQKDYQYAMVGTPDRKYLWILSRKNILDERIYESLLSQAQKLGFDTSALYMNPLNPEL
ncbi:MAG: lipocalin family protein [Spirochaetia bacterium]